jgi:hypothetical protein
MSVPKQIFDNLMTGEEIICELSPDNWAITHQNVLYGIVLTNKRIIFYTRKIFGIDLKDFSWHDLRKINMKENMLFSNEIVFEMKDNYIYPIVNRDKDRIGKLYSLAIEFKTKANEPQAILKQRPAPTDDPVQTLKKLKDLLDANLINQSEYDSKKADILSRM